MLVTNDKGRLTQEQLQHRLENEPQPKSFKLSVPSWLCPEAKKEWKRIVKLFSGMDRPILSDLDISALAIYCEAVARYKEAMEKVHVQGKIIVTKDNPNKPIRNPWAIEADSAALQIKKFSEVLCLNPVARARAGMGKTISLEDDPNGELFD